MTKRLNVFIAIIASLGMVFSSAGFVFATVTKGDIDHTGNFAKDAPIGTITINTADMTAANPDMILATTIDGVQLDTSTSRTKNCVVYAPNGVGDDKAHIASLTGGTPTDLDGNITLTWPGIATLQDGSAADVTMTISNIHFENPKAYSGDPATYYDDAAEGPIGIFSESGFLGPKFTSTNSNDRTGVVGMRCDVNVKVTQDGSPVDGTVLFSTVDLDVVDGRYGGQYAESFQVNSGDVSDIYIPADSKLDISGDKLSATAGDDNTYMTGFVVLADAGAGIDLTWWGQGNGMGTKLFTGNIAHHIDSNTSKGGSIKTTTTGKVGEGDELGPVRVDVPDGKDVSYLMEPEKGFELGKITIDGTAIDPDNSSTWPDFIEVTKDANGNPIVTFKDNADNHSIDVSWNPIVTASSGAGGSISDPGDTGVPSGSSKTYTFTPEEGYEPDTVIVNGKEVTPTKNDDGTWSYTLENVTDPTTIEVTWKKTVIPVKFVDPITGKTIDAQSVEYGSGAKAPMPPVHLGYTFKGWDTVFDKITGETTVIAIYEPNKYIIRYDANGGKGIMNPQHFTGEDAVAMSQKNAFTRDGYTFIGFKAQDTNGNFLKDANGNDIIFKDIYDFKAYLDAMGDGAEITLVAQWEKILPLAKRAGTVIPRTGDGSPVGLFLMTCLSAMLLLALIGRQRSTK